MQQVKSQQVAVTVVHLRHHDTHDNIQQPRKKKHLPQAGPQHSGHPPPNQNSRREEGPLVHPLLGSELGSSATPGQVVDITPGFFFHPIMDFSCSSPARLPQPALSSVHSSAAGSGSCPKPCRNSLIPETGLGSS